MGEGPEASTALPRSVGAAVVASEQHSHCVEVYGSDDNAPTDQRAAGPWPAALPVQQAVSLSSSACRVCTAEFSTPLTCPGHADSCITWVYGLGDVVPWQQSSAELDEMFEGFEAELAAAVEWSDSTGKDPIQLLADVVRGQPDL